MRCQYWPKGFARAGGQKNRFGSGSVYKLLPALAATNRLGFVLDADALAARQGRAEDVLIAATIKLTNNLTAKAGYRLLDGGVANASVYTYSMLHYGVVEVLINLD